MLVILGGQHLLLPPLLLGHDLLHFSLLAKIRRIKHEFTPLRGSSHSSLKMEGEIISAHSGGRPLTLPLKLPVFLPAL